MGKFRNKSRLKCNRFNPITNGRPNKTVKKEPAGLTYIYNKLCSPDESEYLTALHSLSSLASENLQTVSSILSFADKATETSAALLAKVAGYILNEDKSVRLAAVAVIRNISACGSDSHVEQLLQRNVFESLLAALRSYSEALSNEVAHAVITSECWTTLEQLAYAINNICEVSEKAMELVDGVCVNVLMSISSATAAAIAPPVVLAANTALLCLTENNPQVYDAVKPHSARLCSVVDNFKIVDPVTECGGLYNTLTVIGILTNIGECTTTSDRLPKVLSLIKTVLQVPPSQLLQRFIDLSSLNQSQKEEDENNEPPPAAAAANESAKLKPRLSDDDIHKMSSLNFDASATAAALMQNGGAEQELQEQENGDCPTDDGEIVMELSADSTESLKDNGTVSGSSWQLLQLWLPAQQLALELLNNICCGEDGSVSDGGTQDNSNDLCGEDDGDNDCMDQDEKHLADNDNMEDWADLEHDKMERVIQPLLVEHDVFNVVAACSVSPTQHIMEAIKGSVHFTQLNNHVRVVMVRSLAAIQVVMTCLDLEQLGGPQKMFQCWLDLGKIVFTSEGFGTEEGVLEECTGAMRALMEKFPVEAGQCVKAIGQTELQLVFSCGQAASEAGVRRNVARMLGALSVLLLQQGTGHIEEPTYGHLVAITDFLIEMAGVDVELLVCAEALDVIIDIYSDDRTDKLACNCNLIERLRPILNYFNARYKKNKEKFKGDRVLALTVRDNLPAFIRYKEPRVENVGPGKRHAMKEDGKTGTAAKTRGKCKLLTTTRNKKQ